MKEDSRQSSWPPLPLDAWRDTCATVHMWSQIVGKIALALTPRMNHLWNVAMQITPRGLATPPLRHGDRLFTMTFDFVAHDLVIHTSDGATETIHLEPRRRRSAVLPRTRRFPSQAPRIPHRAGRNRGGALSASGCEPGRRHAARGFAR